MELHEIRYFLALSEELNFTKAAKRCHISQPALTRAIRKLEDELGGVLFSRERGNPQDMTPLRPSGGTSFADNCCRYGRSQACGEAVPEAGMRPTWRLA